MTDRNDKVEVKRAYDYEVGQFKFDKIQITQIVKNRAYSAATNVWDNKTSFGMEFTMGGTSPENCIDKMEKFFKIKIEPSMYIVLPKQKSKSQGT